MLDLIFIPGGEDDDEALGAGDELLPSDEDAELAFVICSDTVTSGEDSLS